jgi:hypothetical protein
LALLANLQERKETLRQDTAQDAPFDVEPDLIIYAEQDARGIWVLEQYCDK